MYSGILSIQFNPVLGDKKANIKKITKIIGEYAGRQLDLVVLPEFFSTGIHDESFINRPEDETGDDTINAVRALAKKYNTNIAAGSVVTLESGKRYNTCFIIGRNGDIIGKYRKIHLFENEDKYITPGNESLVVDLDFARAGISICFDIKFPLLYQELLKMGAEIFVSPSAWCIPDICSQKAKNDCTAAWRAMNICRAAETMTYFISSNQTGMGDKNLFCIGNSMICGPYGAVYADCKGAETGIYARINLDIIKNLKHMYTSK